MKSFVLTRRFWPLFAAQTLGAFADNTLRMATIVAVFAAASLEGSSVFALPFGLGEYAGTLVSMAFTIPVFLFSVIAGQLADQRPRHHLIKRLKAIELLLMIFASLCFAIGNGPLLVFALFLMGTQSAFFSPVRTSVMPQYFSSHELIKANGYFNAALFVALVTGLGLGGYYVNQEGGRLIISTLLVTAAGLGALFALGVPNAPAPGLLRLNWNIPQVAWRQIRFAQGLKGIWYPMLGIAWFWAIGAAVLANLPNYVRDSLGGGDTEISLLQALFAIGAGVGSIGAGLLGTKMKDSFTLAGIGVAGTVLGTLFIWLITAQNNPTETMSADGLFHLSSLPLLITFILTAAANGLFVVPLMAALQARAPESDRAQIMGTSNMTNGAGATLGAFFIVPLREVGLSAMDVFLCMSGLQLALFIFMIKRRHAIRQAAAKMTISS
ncbi:MAG: MFS transporter [Pseudomonadota bacterium]